MGEQRREKMVKKPKKDTAPPKTGTPSDRPQAPMTSVLPKGKMKNKQRVCFCFDSCWRLMDKRWRHFLSKSQTTQPRSS